MKNIKGLSDSTKSFLYDLMQYAGVPKTASFLDGDTQSMPDSHKTMAFPAASLDSPSMLHLFMQGLRQGINARTVDTVALTDPNTKQVIKKVPAEEMLKIMQEKADFFDNAHEQPAENLREPVDFGLKDSLGKTAQFEGRIEDSAIAGSGFNDSARNTPTSPVITLEAKIWKPTETDSDAAHNLSMKLHQDNRYVSGATVVLLDLFGKPVGEPIPLYEYTNSLDQKRHELNMGNMNKIQDKLDNDLANPLQTRERLNKEDKEHKLWDKW